MSFEACFPLTDSAGVTPRGDVKQEVCAGTSGKGSMTFKVSSEIEPTAKYSKRKCVYRGVANGVRGLEGCMRSTCLQERPSDCVGHQVASFNVVCSGTANRTTILL